MFCLESSHSSYEPHMKEKSRSSYRFYLSKVDYSCAQKDYSLSTTAAALYRNYPPGARCLYLNFLRVDSKNGHSTEMEFCCSDTRQFIKPTLS